MSQTGVGVSALIPHDDGLSPFTVSLSTIVTGTATYTIQHTFDDVFAAGYDPTAGNWFPADDPVLVGATTNQNSNYIAPVTASRINQTVGSGTVTLTALQGTKG